MLFPRYFTMPASRKLMKASLIQNSINNKLFLLVSTAWNQTFHQYWNLFLSLIPDVVILSFSELVMVLVSQGLIPLLTNGFQNCIQINHRFYIIKIRCLFLYIKIEWKAILHCELSEKLHYFQHRKRDIGNSTCKAVLSKTEGTFDSPCLKSSTYCVAVNKETSFCYWLSQYQDVLQQEQQALIMQWLHYLTH